jgi:two-component system sensor histidine kinase DevS
MLADSVAGAMLDASPDGVLLVRADGSIASANIAAADLFGHAREDLLDMMVEDLMPSGVRDGHVARRQGYNAAPSSRPMDTGLQLYAERGDAALIPVEISLSPLTVDDDVCTIVTVRDVSERSETIAKVALLSERERIARDIHDMVIQRLFAAGMSLQAVVGMAEPPMVSERVSSVVDELDDTIRELRSAIFQLGVPDARRSLVAHLAAVVDAGSDHLGFTPELRIIGDIDTIPDFVGEQLVATVTESLSNVARHAKATESEVTVVLDDGALRLTVSDNGVGIVGSPKPNGGLSNIVWRATELGGTCVVQTGSPKGTVISWHVPV